MTFADKIRKRFLPFLLSGTILAGYFSCSTPGKIVSRAAAPAHAETTIIDSVLEAEIQRQLCLSNDKYTYEQAAVRAIANKNGAFNYPGRDEKKLSFLFSTCAQTDYTADQVPDTAITLWQNMQSMKNSQTLIGPHLADFSTKASIFYGYASMKGTDGLWYDYDGTLWITNSKGYSQDELLLVQAHEIIHGIQRTTKTREKYMTWSLRDFQMSCLASEAASEAGANLLALEMKLDSINGPWNVLKKKNRSGTAHLLVTYVDNILNDSTPYAKALAAAGKEEFYAPFKKQWWLNFYNDRMMGIYINFMVDSALMRQTGGRYTLEKARQTGYISPEFNFTAGLDSLPSPQTCFGKNTRMKQAYAYVELERLGYTLGRQDSLYLKTLARLEKEKNPYLGVDLKLVSDVCRENNIGALAMMDAFAKLLKKPAPAAVKTKSRKP